MNDYKRKNAVERIGQYRNQGEYYQEEERFDWENARLIDGTPEDEWGIDRSVYATKLTARQNPDISFYSFVAFHNDGMPYVDIPLKDPRGTRKNLVEEFYTSATFFGGIDKDKFEELATDEYKIDDVMTYLNQSVAGANNDQLLDWFYDNLNVANLEGSEGVLISCHSGMGSFSATIELVHYMWSEGPVDLDTFAARVNEAYPHLKLEALSKDDYLKAIESMLPFQPKDWDVTGNLA